VKRRIDWLKQIKEICKIKNGECLSDKCDFALSEILLRCDSGHEWTASATKILRGQWCKKCAINKSKKNIKDCIFLANKNNGECLSKEINNIKEKLIWKCKNGHIFEKSFNKVQQGSWCKICSKRVPHTIKDCNDAALKLGGKCLENKYINLKSNMLWECSEGHQWKASFANILHNNRWCMECYKKNRHKYNLNNLIEIATQKGGECLDFEYKNYNTKINWKCKNGHIFKKNMAEISQDQWCPRCKEKSKIQRKLFEIIKDIYIGHIVRYDFKKLDWLILGKGRQEIDIYVESIKLAIEYDGKHHFKPVKFGGCNFNKAKEIHLKSVKLDNIKNEKIKQHPEDVKYFIRFNYKEKITKEYVLNKLKENNIPIEVNNVLHIPT